MMCSVGFAGIGCIPGKASQYVCGLAKVLMIRVNVRLTTEKTIGASNSVLNYVLVRPNNFEVDSPHDSGL
jgi:hypothetical protein